MHVSKLRCLAILALISSCRGAGDVPADTDGVVSGTQPERAAVVSERETASVVADRAPGHDGDLAMPSAVSAGRLVGVAGSRFVVFDTAERTIVLDLETDHAFGVAGHPATEHADGFDPWSEAGFSPSGVPTRVIASNDGNTLLVWADDVLEAVDLTRNGALLADWRGEAEEVDIAPDGSMFAVRTGNRVDLVRTIDGARASYAHRSTDTAGPTVRWTESGAYWADADGVRAVDRSSFATLDVTMANADVTASADGQTFVISRHEEGGTPGLVEVWRMGETKPRSRIASAHVEQITLAQDGGRVAWAETSGEYGAPTFLHTLAVTSGVHARFSAHGHCAIGVERIVGFDEEALVTDAECSPGCPSLPSQAQLIAYDFATGKKLREWSGELIPPSNEELGAHVAKADELVARLGLSRDQREVLPLIHSPGADVLVVATGSGLRLVDETGRALAALSSSNGLAADDVRFTPDGRHVVGVGDGRRLRVWEASGGRLVWSWN